MSKILHITNGDSFTSRLQDLKTEGEIITWREALCEGKTTTDVGSESFWRTRFEFFKSAYKVTKQKFVDLTLKEYRRLCNSKSQDEIVLWFEYDLFCQINMIAVLSWLKKNRKDAVISLVCSGKEDNTDRMYGLSELSDKRIQALFKTRLKLTKDDIEYADYIWQLYCGDNPFMLQNAIRNNKSQFEYLSPAIEAHLHRFPSIKNGLNELENKILQTATEQKFESKEKLVGHLLKNQGFYGFGDLQYFKMLDDLKPLFGSFSPVKLTKLGNAVVNKSANYYSVIRNEEEYLGGAPKYSFLYDEEAAKLLKL